MKSIEEAKELKKYVHQFLLNLDSYLFDLEGPSETIISFLSHFGYHWSSSTMEVVVPTGIFSSEELDILAQIENLLVKLFDSHHGQEGGWSYLEKEEYLILKSLSHEYLTMSFD